VKKLAIFVEGQTEQMFAERLVNEIAGKHKVSIQKDQIRGPSRHVHLKGRHANQAQEYFVLIFDCGTDNRVKSDIRDNYDSLVSNGYDGIVGIRDVYPEVDYSQIPMLRAGLQFKMRTKPIKVLFALGVMETETWFIAEHTHFLRLDGKLTTSYIHSHLGFDPSHDDLERLPHPAGSLDAIYRLAGLSYDKNKVTVQRTVEILDYAYIYCSLVEKFVDLSALIEAIDAFLLPARNAMAG
jgi:hypothetical protein